MINAGTDANSMIAILQKQATDRFNLLAAQNPNQYSAAELWRYWDEDPALQDLHTKVATLKAGQGLRYNAGTGGYNYAPAARTNVATTIGNPVTTYVTPPAPIDNGMATDIMARTINAPDAAAPAQPRGFINFLNSLATSLDKKIYG